MSPMSLSLSLIRQMNLLGKKNIFKYNFFKEKKIHQIFDMNTWISIIETLNFSQFLIASWSFTVTDLPNHPLKRDCGSASASASGSGSARVTAYQNKFSINFLNWNWFHYYLIKCLRKSNTHDESEQNPDKDQREFHFELIFFSSF